MSIEKDCYPNTTHFYLKIYIYLKQMSKEPVKEKKSGSGEKQRNYENDVVHEHKQQNMKTDKAASQLKV